MPFHFHSFRFFASGHFIPLFGIHSLSSSSARAPFPCRCGHSLSSRLSFLIQTPSLLASRFVNVNCFRPCDYDLSIRRITIPSLQKKNLIFKPPSFCNHLTRSGCHATPTCRDHVPTPFSNAVPSLPLSRRRSIQGTNRPLKLTFLRPPFAFEHESQPQNIHRHGTGWAPNPKKSTPFTASIRLRSLDADFLENPINNGRMRMHI